MKVIPILFLVLTLSSCASLFQRKEPEPPKFTVNLSSRQVELGMAEMQRDRNFPSSGLTKVEITVIYFPEEDALCLRYRSDFFTYNQFWHANGRDLFLRSLNRYMDEYERRSLVDSNSRASRTRYGNTEGYLTWQEYSFTRRFSGNMAVDIGYAFRERSPYFTVTQRQTSNTGPDRGGSSTGGSTNSQEIAMYFTRAQAQELAAFFDEEVLREHAVTRPERRVVPGEVEFDVW